jgi:hypothetical protein
MTIRLEVYSESCELRLLRIRTFSDTVVIVDPTSHTIMSVSFRRITVNQQVFVQSQLSRCDLSVLELVRSQRLSPKYHTYMCLKVPVAFTPGIKECTQERQGVGLEWRM